MSDNHLEQNKRVVARLFDEVFYGPDLNLEVIDEIVADGYIQHNPLAGQGPEGLKKFVTELLPLPEGLDASGTLEVNYIAEGDFVVRQEIRNHGMLIDIFRVKDGLLREHWDAFRPDPGTDRLPGF
jgi:predicted SnoaL-like aldol condensation-catalyzing enzyme